MKFFRFLTKAYKTFFCVAKYLPDVLKELKDLKGCTFLMINELKTIWHL